MYGIAHKTGKPSAHRPRANSRGQSLVEFVLVMPILVLILVGGFSMGMGTYQAHMASSAIQLPGANKLALADNQINIAPTTLAGYANTGAQTGGLGGASAVDSIQVVPVDPYTSMMVASKGFTATASFLPSFTVRVSQVMNANLLQNASTGTAESHPFSTAWVPGGTPAKPPWEGGVAGVPAAPAAAPAAAPPAAIPPVAP